MGRTHVVVKVCLQRPSTSTACAFALSFHLIDHTVSPTSSVTSVAGNVAGAVGDAGEKTSAVHVHGRRVCSDRQHRMRRLTKAA